MSEVSNMISFAHMHAEFRTLGFYFSLISHQ